MKKLTDDLSDKQRLLKAFPLSLHDDLEKVLEILPWEGHVLLGDNEIEVFLNSESLIIPSRVYFNEPDPNRESQLTDVQKTILNCIYLKHHNGFIRQKRLAQILDKTDCFIIPYTFHLLGEYVMEILEVLEQHINPKTIESYVNFIGENKKYRSQTESRMISYWNEYYRQKYKKINNYIGKKIVVKLKHAESKWAI